MARPQAKPPPTNYQILQVHPAAPLDLITAAYWRLVSQVHTAGRSDKAAEIAVYHLTRSYQVLANPQTRSEYDSSIGIPAQPGAPHLPVHPRASWMSSFLSGKPDMTELGGDDVDYYELLRLDPLANAGIAAEAYLVMRNYYLRLIERAGASRELIDLLAEGFEVVSDAKRRREYDRNLKARRRAASAKPAIVNGRHAAAAQKRGKDTDSGEEFAERLTRPKRTARARTATNGRGPAARSSPKVQPSDAHDVVEPASIKIVRSLASGLRLGGKHSISLARKASQTLRDVLVDDREAPVSVIDLTPKEEEALLERLSSFPDTVVPSETKPKASRSGVLARLSIIDGPGLGRSFDVDSVPFTLGEDDVCDITLPGLALQQARLLHRDGQFVLFSLTDEPKTSIHGNAVAWAVLENGDSFEIGPYQLTFEAATLAATRA